MLCRGITIVIALFLAASDALGELSRPNVLWLTCEDVSPTLGCYGDDYAVTPNLDRLAEQGVRYTQAVGVSGVCAVNRSCLITGMYPSTIGSQDMRSRIRLPESIPTYSQLLRRAGYYTTNCSKTDYNFPTPSEAWDECSGKAHWKNRKPGQPFFAVFNYVDSHESRIWAAAHKRVSSKLKPEELHDPARAPVPPFHPNCPEVRRDWANYYDNVTAMDHWVAAKLKELDDAGLADDTIVFFYSDHGAGMPLCKKWVWDWGLRVPLIVRFPKKYACLAPAEPGTATDRLVSFIDFPPTLLSLVGVDVPAHMQGRAFLGLQAAEPRKYAFATRDRMAEWYATVRVVRSKEFQYHRNFMPHLSYAPFASYTMRMPTSQVMTRMHEAGEFAPTESDAFSPRPPERRETRGLDAIQRRAFLPKPTEELYNVAADPHMIRNLAGDPFFASTLAEMRRELKKWQLRTRDLGLLSECEMHRRAEGTTQYAVGQSETANPLQKILPVAYLAGRRDPDDLPRLVERLDDEEPVVRWWAALGLVMLGEKARPAEESLKQKLEDDSPQVRVAAAEALQRLGRNELARGALVEALKDPSPCVRLRAMNVLYRMGDDARLALPAIRSAGMKGIFPADYLNRMVDYLPKRLEQKP